MMPFLPIVRVARFRLRGRGCAPGRALLPPHRRHPLPRRLPRHEDGAGDGRHALRPERAVHCLAGVERARLPELLDRHPDGEGITTPLTFTRERAAHGRGALRFGLMLPGPHRRHPDVHRQAPDARRDPAARGRAGRGRRQRRRRAGRGRRPPRRAARLDCRRLHRRRLPAPAAGPTRRGAARGGGAGGRGRLGRPPVGWDRARARRPQTGLCPSSSATRLPPRGPPHGGEPRGPERPGGGTPLVVADHLAPHVGPDDRLRRGSRTANPYWPGRAPVDAYCSLLVERIDFRPPAPGRAASRGEAGR